MNALHVQSLLESVTTWGDLVLFCEAHQIKVPDNVQPHEWDNMRLEQRLEYLLNEGGY
jgi:hypothetical protein